MRIDFKTPVGRITLYTTAGIILLAAILITLRETPDAVIYQGKIKEAVYREKIAAVKEKAQEIQDEKDKLLSEIADLGNQIIEAVEPAQVKTVIIEKVEYVPKTEYVKVYNNAIFSGEIIEKYARFVKRDKELQQVNLQAVEVYETHIRDQQLIIEKLSKISKRKWHISAGLVAGVGPRGWFAGAGIGLMYTIR